MTQINKYNLSEQNITSIVIDETNQDYLWVCFDQDTNGNCAIQKVSANNPLQKYFDIDLAVTKINKIIQYSTYVFLAVDDSTILGKRLSKSNPISSTVSYTIPEGIIEAPIDVIANATNVYFLIPGVVSGTNTKVCVFTTAGSFVQTIDLSLVNNASALTFDNVGEIWIVTNTSPSHYVRVYFNGTWNYTIN